MSTLKVIKTVETVKKSFYPSGQIETLTETDKYGNKNGNTYSWEPNGKLKSVGRFKANVHHDSTTHLDNGFTEKHYYYRFGKCAKADDIKNK